MIFPGTVVTLWLFSAANLCVRVASGSQNGSIMIGPLSTKIPWGIRVARNEFNVRETRDNYDTCDRWVSVSRSRTMALSSFVLILDGQIWSYKPDITKYFNRR